MNRFVVANPIRCIACFACQAACVENHKNAGLQAFPRLFVSILQSGTVPILCHHCEDAPCAMVCPVHAIGYENDSVQLNESLCIGCKLCSLACPFGVIFLGGTPIPSLELNKGHYSYINVPPQAEQMQLREMNKLDFLPAFSSSPGEKTIAIKCDLCYFDAEGPACIRACPHDALSLLDDKKGDLTFALGLKEISLKKAKNERISKPAGGK
jgi:Fe-S-cluster-containing hydrogenase component 2